MTEEQLDIARKFGASAFLIYQVVKIYPGSSHSELAMSSGLEIKTVRVAANKLEEAGIIKSEIGRVNHQYGKKFHLN